MIVGGCALLLCFVGMGTISRNSDWRTEKSLWEDALAKAPGSGRAYHNLAWGYYDRIGDTNTSIALYRNAIEKQIHRKDSVAAAYRNIGNIYYHRGDYGEAILQYRQSLLRNPNSVKTQLRLIHALMALSEWDQALTAVDNFIPLGNLLGELYHLKGIVLLNLHQDEAALKWFRKANLANGGKQWKNLAGIGQSLHLMGKYEMGDFYLRTAQALAPDKEFILLNRLDLFLSVDQHEKAAAMADQFVSSIPSGHLKAVWEKNRTNGRYYPLRYNRIHPHIVAALQRSMAGFEAQLGFMTPMATRR
jgi:tetratricopeptide (TPR) repeat protein